MKTLHIFVLFLGCTLALAPHCDSSAKSLGGRDSETDSVPEHKDGSQSLSTDKEFYDSGTDFLSTCSVVDRVKGKAQSAADMADARACQSFVRGVVDGVALQHMWSRSHGDQTKAAFCVQFEKLPSVQLVEAVLQYLRDNPERRRFGAAVAIEETLHNKFPCRR